MILAEVVRHYHSWAWLREYFDLLHDWAHYLFELTLEFLTGVLLIPPARYFWRRALKRHDKEVHSVELSDEEIAALRNLLEGFPGIKDKPIRWAGIGTRKS